VKKDNMLDFYMMIK